MPLLFGGEDGATVTNELLSLGYDNVLLLVSSFSNPESTIHHARANGYFVKNFVVLPLQFGYYSSEPKVKKHIEKLRKNKMAFYSVLFLLFQISILCIAVKAAARARGA